MTYTALLALGLVSCGASTTEPEDPVLTLVTEVTTGPESCEVGEADGDLNVYMRDGSLDPGILSEFELEFEVDVLVDTFDSDEEVEPKLQSGAAYDVVATSSARLDELIDNGLILELHEKLIPNLADVDPFFGVKDTDRSSGFSAPYRWGTFGIGLNTERVGEISDPSWALLFDSELISAYPSGVSLLDDSRRTLGAALDYLGYPPNSDNRSELGEAASLISNLLDSVVAFDSTNYAEALVDGEVDAALGRSDLFLQAFGDQSDTFAFVIPREGALAWVDILLIPSTSQHLCTAHAFIDFALSEESAASLTKWNFYAGTRTGAEAYVDPDVLTEEASNLLSDPSESLVIIDEGAESADVYAGYFEIARSRPLGES